MTDRESTLKGLTEISEYMRAKADIAGIGKGKEVFDSYYRAAEDALALLREQSPDKDINVPGKWISVKDRLPDNDNEVITAYKIDDEKAMKKRKGKLFVKTGNWTGSRWISVWDEYKSYATEEEVLYWMPLPEPPKEVSE